MVTSTDRQPRVQWIIARAEEGDAQQLGQIAWRAFENSDINEFTRPRYKRPNWSTEEKDQNAAKRILGALRDPNCQFIKAVHPDDSSKIVGCATWTVPRTLSDTPLPEDPEPDPSVRDAQVDYEASRKLKVALTNHAYHLMGSRKHLNLLSLATHTDYLRQGVAGALLEWGIEQAREQNIPILIESVPHAKPVYEAKSFVQRGPVFEMQYDARDLQGQATGQKGSFQLYDMVLEPSAT